MLSKVFVAAGALVAVVITPVLMAPAAIAGAPNCKTNAGRYVACAGQFANDSAQPANRHVRHRMFAIVDRTNLRQKNWGKSFGARSVR